MINVRLTKRLLLRSCARAHARGVWSGRSPLEQLAAVAVSQLAGRTRTGTATNVAAALRCWSTHLGHRTNSHKYLNIRSLSYTHWAAELLEGPQARRGPVR